MSYFYWSIGFLLPKLLYPGQGYFSLCDVSRSLCLDFDSFGWRFELTKKKDVLRCILFLIRSCFEIRRGGATTGHRAGKRSSPGV